MICRMERAELMEHVIPAPSQFLKPWINIVLTKAAHAKLCASSRIELC